MSLTDTAITKIRGMIVSGELRPGDRLPREADLADRLGLSRNSLREAVRALSLIRVLDVRQGDGTYVTSLEPSVLLEAMGFIVDLHRDDSLLQFFEVRRILESAAASLAAQSATEAQIADLAALLDDLGEQPSVDELLANDLEFHRRVAAVSGNEVLVSLIETVSSRTQRARIWRGLTENGAVRRTIAEHRAILDAIGAGRADLASAAMTMHVAGVESWLRTQAQLDDGDG
ncbi:GntR family transcriptional repressor for pyruvate dehydrogenase complex [Actinoalloteichus hoggarensis]|uniref:HTH-type transcriptional regulator LutR n=1 Tax=Actinoalloteichus hoggarensis TaxID=1470176 RepID=A0A221W277_9PSEU|nr:FadR/GntR family transcriptional regulator [Actinoalloteichus hoggarensis]ASO19878.1 HTH-type transcriptional regulator LutR [Actinoalloteichus hoggarensis]MBB5919413.1 GntR family transcriptional repressor for pyruvate dehydrogenase complex [Actinoalloteichus hoggarensis]